jgi:hypothetical protein
LTALEQTARGLTGLQPVANQTERVMTRGFQNQARAAQQSAAQIVAASNRMRGSLRNAAFQVADIAQQLEAGVNAVRVFAVQGA